jgi:hypothetical protein
MSAVFLSHQPFAAGRCLLVIAAARSRFLPPLGDPRATVLSPSFGCTSAEVTLPGEAQRWLLALYLLCRPVTAVLSPRGVSP